MGVTIDPHTLVPDDYTQGDIDIQVYARVEVDGDLVSSRATLSAIPVNAVNAPSRTSAEFGSSGKLLPDPGDANQDFRFVFLGTLTLPVDRSRPLRWTLQVAASWLAGSTGVVGLDYLWIAPRRALARGAERKALIVGYPYFATTTTETTRTIRADGSGLLATPPAPASPYHSLGGEPIELPSGVCDLAVKLSSMVPDDPTLTWIDSEFLAQPATLRVSVTPRYAVVRS